MCLTLGHKRTKTGRCRQGGFGLCQQWKWREAAVGASYLLDDLCSSGMFQVYSNALKSDGSSDQASNSLVKNWGPAKTSSLPNSDQALHTVIIWADSGTDVSTTTVFSDMFLTCDQSQLRLMWTLLQWNLSFTMSNASDYQFDWWLRSACGHFTYVKSRICG